MFMLFENNFIKNTKGGREYQPMLSFVVRYCLSALPNPPGVPNFKLSLASTDGQMGKHFTILITFLCMYMCTLISVRHYK